MNNENPFSKNVAVSVFGLFLLYAAVIAGLVTLVEAVNRDDRRDGHITEVKLYIDPQPEHPLKQEYPEFFTTEAVVVSFGADWCSACRRQAIELKGPSVKYNILKVEVEKDGQKTRWSKLMDQLKLGESIPVTVVVSKGEILKVFHGFTLWSDILPYAEKAKKSDGDKTHNIDIGPIHIDWDNTIDTNRRGKPRP